MSEPFSLGIQSYCFRKFLPIPELVDALERAGLAYVEIWPNHLPWTWPDQEREAALSDLGSHGITVNAYGQVRFPDETESRQIFGLAKRLGIKALTADPDPESFGMLETLSEEYGIRIAVHNHGRKHRYGHFDELQAVFARTSERFGLCLDAAWFLDAGCEPLEAIDLFADRIYGVHLKDFVFDESGGHEDVIIGTGGLDLPGLMTRLREIGFNGYMSIEYEGDPEHPLPAVIECVQAAKEAMIKV